MYTHQLLDEQLKRNHPFSYTSLSLFFDAYLPAFLVAVVLLSKLWPSSPNSTKSLWARVFTSFVTPDDVHEYDRAEKKAREQQQHSQIQDAAPAAQPAALASNGYGSTAEGSASVAHAREDEGDSETSPLLGRSTKSHQTGASSDHAPKQPAAVQFGLSIVNLAHLLVWITALLFCSLSSTMADRIGAEAGFQSASGLRLVAALQVFGWFFATVSSSLFPSPTPPYALLTFYAFQLIGSAVSAYHSLFSVPHAPLHPPHRSQLAPPIFSLLSSLLVLFAISLIMSLPLQVYDRNPQNDRHGHPPPMEDYCTLWQWTSFSWINPLLRTALARPLEETDVWQLSKLSKSPILLKNMRKIQNDDMHKYQSAKLEAEQRGNPAAAAKAEKSKPNILWQIFWMNSRDMALDFILTIVSYTLAYASPFFIRQILQALETDAAPEFAARSMSHFSIPFDSANAVQHEGPQRHALPLLDVLPFVASNSITPARQRAFLFAFFALLASVIKTQTDLQHLYYGRRASVRIKSELTLAIYDKALRRKDISGSLQNTTSTAQTQETDKDKKDKKPKQTQEDDDKSAASVGKVVNLMSTDANTVSMTITMLYMAYSAPIELVIATTFLYKLLGWSAFAGVVPALILMPSQQLFTKLLYNNSKATLKARDKRVTILNELITSIRFIKFFAWEQGWSERVLQARREEIAWFYRGIWILCGLMVSFALVPTMFTITAFATYTMVQGKQLDVATGFTALALFAMLKNPLSVLPMVINQIFQAKVSMDRIDTYLHEDEVPEWVIQNCSAETDAQIDEALKDRTIELKDATLRWHAAKKHDQDKAPAKPSFLSSLMFWKKKAPATTDESTEDNHVQEEATPFHLTALDFRPPAGKMTLVCGPTGSGKSSLLSAILGEMELLDGSIVLPKRPLQLLSGGVSYCCQTAWLETMSIRDNIVFGQKFDQERYDQVLECCCLKPDLTTFPDGDDTEIGENGVSLSGGQKARVALARAVYSRSPVLLLDDVLAAVDSHTARKLVDECLCGDLVRGRTIVLVTHHVEAVLPHIAHVIMLEGGRIRASGSPTELKAEGLLSALVSDSNSKGKQAATDEQLKEEVKDAVVEAQAKAQADPDKSTEESKNKDATSGRGKLVKAEGKSTGRVKREIYMTWLTAFGWLPIGIVLFGIMISRSADVMEKVWLSFWGGAYQSPPTGRLGKWFPDPNEDVLPYLIVYAGCVLTWLFAGNLSAVIVNLFGVAAGNRLFKRMLFTVVRSPTRFFDQTPTGRILNRFTKDVETVDDTLSMNVRMLVMFTVGTLFGMVSIAFTVPAFVPALLVITYVYYRTAVWYIAAARDLRRLESVTRSPIFQSFSEVLNGIGTVRAFGAQERFLETLFRRLDASQSCNNLYWMANRWLLLRFDLMGAMTVFGASVVALAGGVNAGLAGIAITQAQLVVLSLYWICRVWTGFEMDLNSVERMCEYFELPQEPPAIVEENRPPADWPSKTDSRGIQVKDLVLKYATDLDPVLRGVDFEIGAGEKVGLVGRTGSGKSTLALAFFRFVEFEQGSIVIDGIDISKIGLEDLRSRLTIIPQDPVLFSGTIRENLDPFDERTDEECLLALRRVNLKTSPINTAAPSVLPSRAASRAASIHENSTEVNGSSSSSTAVNSMLPGEHSAGTTVFTLETKVSEGGSNFSQGQRQLISMARALLRSTSIIFMDEATASVDFETDTQIQKTLRSPLGVDVNQKTTIITIAHRLKTIIDYDRILVMDKGRITENDSPAALLERKGIFYEMCRKTGEYDELELMARLAASS